MRYKEEFMLHFSAFGLVLLSQRVLRSTLLAILTVSFSMAIAFGQASTGAITGTVTDPSNAVTPGAKIEARNVSTGVVYSLTTNSSGLYLIPDVPIGHYKVSAELQGFKRSEQPDVEIRIGDRKEVDFRLEVGAVTERVEVTGQAPLLDTASASRNEVISPQAVANLPLIGRNSYLLALTQTGVIQNGVGTSPGSQPSNSDRPFDNGGMDSESINGSPAYRNDFTMNGLPNTNQEGGAANLTFVPNPDAAQEISVSSNQYDAQFGHTGGERSTST
jgi:hypothetical protein